MVFRKQISGLMVALILGSTAVVTGHAAEQFIPQGYVYGPGHDELPPLNSEQDRIDAMAAVRQTEIYKSQYRERRFRENLDRMLDHDFTTPNALNSAW